MEFGGVGTKKILSFIAEEWTLLLILTFIFLIYFYYTSTFDYFEKNGIPYRKPTIFVGNMGPRLIPKESFHEYQMNIYNKFKGKQYGGVFEGRKPVFYVIDPELMKRVLISDSRHFENRSTINTNEPMYLRRSLLNLKGSEWKGVRSTLTPTFSSARLKNMLPLVQHCAEQMVTFLKQYDAKDVEMKSAIGRYTLEVIGACAFGIKSDALCDENSRFIQVAEKFSASSIGKRMVLLFGILFMPKLLRLFNISFLNLESTDELVKMLNVAKAERRASGIKQNDFLQLLLDAVVKEPGPDNEEQKTIKHLDDDTIDAQALLFLIAGYDTSRSLLSFALHTLACEPDVQDKLRAHVFEATEGKELDYDLLAQMTYLEAFLLETLRIYPALGRIDRSVSSPCTLPGTTIQLSPGDTVAVPVYGVHMDADIYPDPTSFRPERFMGEEKNNRPPHLFLAFGAGPRNCIGMRFAMISTKLAMIHLLRNFKFSKCDKTVEKVVFHKRTMLLSAESGLWVRLDSL